MSHFSPIRRPSRAAGHLRERCLLPIRLQHKRAKSSRNIPPSLAISQPPAIFRNEPPNFSAPQFSVRRLDTLPIIEYNSKAIGVWRSLVSRLVRVQEAAGSNPATPTIENSIANGCFAVLFLYLLVNFKLLRIF